MNYMAASKKLLTKGELCEIFGLISVQSGRKYYHRLRKFVLTDEILTAAGIPITHYSQKRVFTAEQSNRLRILLKIEEHELAT